MNFKELFEINLLSKSHNKFLLKNRGLNLSKDQQLIIKQLRDKCKQKIYKLKPNSCVCGANSDVLIAVRDRYGINIHTVICKNCGLIRTNPYYTEETLNEFYNEEYRKLYIWGERNDETFFENQINSGKRYLKNLQNILNSNFDNKTVYEIGCGMGGILKPFKDNNCSIKGIDLGEEYINIGKNKYQLDLITGKYNNLKEYGQADLIILSHVLEHITNPVDFLKNLRDLITDNGLLYIAVPTIETIPINYHYNIFYYLQNAHIFDFSTETIRYIVELAGYKPIKIIEDEGAIIVQKTNVYRSSTDVPKNEYKNAINLLNHYDKKFFNSQKSNFNLLENIFSIKNDYSNKTKHKVITILGAKIKFKCKKISSQVEATK